MEADRDESFIIRIATSAVLFHRLQFYRSIGGDYQGYIAKSQAISKATLCLSGGFEWPA